MKIQGKSQKVVRNFYYLVISLKKSYLHTKEGRTLLENNKKYSVVKVFFFSLLLSAGMGERWGKGEEGARSLASSARGKEEANPLFSLTT